MQKRLAVFSDEHEFHQLREIGHSAGQMPCTSFRTCFNNWKVTAAETGFRFIGRKLLIRPISLGLEIAQRPNAKSMVKGKSMVSEEMELNNFLKQHGIEALEADLGEYFIQVDHELPSHIIMPAIHKNKEQIAQMFHQKVEPNVLVESAEEMTAIARKVLRRKFYQADIGVSGVNFAVAETGTLCLVENEGNGRFCTTLPPVHVALKGIEKVVERLEDVPPLLSLLTRSATGQAITTYFNMITSPRKDGEKDGPKNVYLILLDNGRTQMHSDQLLRETLCAYAVGHA
ncbi:MAG: hypothetical protein CM1200mP28_16500 [Deltaproteobacteria bacterium]|nr:MAG: hypothetical protein CM1200mP28_16500 [Deltaproteobacteria bacterium]